jgi:hypothetical protein
MGTRSLLGVEIGQGITLTPHPLLVPRFKKQSRAIPLLSLRAFMVCKKGETYLLKISATKNFLWCNYFALFNMCVRCLPVTLIVILIIVVNL